MAAPDARIVVGGDLVGKEEVSEREELRGLDRNPVAVALDLTRLDAVGDLVERAARLLRALSSTRERGR